ncbi:hypothetical protein [Bacillus mycoides]|uniref:hypothetical protein n=1 Tax=Bacillus mycoides TaxID=1405 RepID=UPI003D651326
MEIKDLFVETKKVVADYKEKAGVLDQEEQELKVKLEELQDEMIAIILDQEGETVSELVYLKIRLKEINQKTDIYEVFEDSEVKKENHL